MMSIVDIKRSMLLRSVEGDADDGDQVASSCAKAMDGVPGLAAQVACAQRELALRRNTYPKQVAAGRMTAARAAQETAAMAAIVATLERCRLLEEVSEEIKGRK